VRYCRLIRVALRTGAALLFINPLVA
jgi:hypothetical protein